MRFAAIADVHGNYLALEAVLAEEFGIEGVSLAEAWPRIVARHDAVFGA